MIQTKLDKKIITIVLIVIIVICITIILYNQVSQPQKPSNQDSHNTNNTITNHTMSIYANNSDGYVKFFGTPDVHSWNDVRDAKVGTEAGDNISYYSKGILTSYNRKEGDLFVISRSYFPFNTSSLGNNAVIKNVTLFIYGIGTNESNICAVPWLDGPNGLSEDDYSMIGDINLGFSVSWHIDQYNPIMLNSQGRDYISTTGWTYICCREYLHDFYNVSPWIDGPLNEFRNGHYYSDEPGTDKDPYLFIEYSLIS
jgi:hypothetical protein